MEIVISDTNIFIDLWNIGLLERFCELPLSIHTTDFIIGELKTQGVKDAIAQLHQKGIMCHDKRISFFHMNLNTKKFV